MILPWLLHFANRHRSFAQGVQDEFYTVKDRILKRGKKLDYDIQHIPGKTCHSCGGRGERPKYGHNGKIYDWADCYCFGGWYRLPKWICLQRIQFGRFVFHKPLKRHQCVENPFTLEEMGWEVTNRPIIEGYIEHEAHPLSEVSFLFLLWLYRMPSAEREISKFFFWRWIHLRNKWVNFWHQKPFILWKPRFKEPKWMHADEKGQLFYEEDMPF